ncbi:MAG: PEP-CTERM sorting domain-containing protein [Planctomycetota bacterium]|jgi:hypothetical protein
MRVSFLVAVVFAGLLSAGTVHADPIAQGNLVAVFTDTGSFYHQEGELAGTLNLSQSYTVVHFFEYSPESDFSRGMIPIAFPAEGTGDLLNQFANVNEGSEYFLIGGVLGVGEIPDGRTVPSDSHLMLSASNDGAVPQLNAFEQMGDELAYHNALVQGTLDITSNGPLFQMSGTDFWNAMLTGYTGEFGANAFFELTTLGPTGAVERISGDVFSTVENEELFGHTGKPALAGEASFTLEGGLDLTYTDANNLVYTNPVPEPGTAALVCGGLGILLILRRRRRRSA